MDVGTHWTEADRLVALARYDGLDAAPEPILDDIVHLAAQICATPIALISLVGETHQRFTARLGLKVSQTPLTESLCVLTLRHDGPLVVPDLTQDARTRDNPVVTGAAHMRFYAGVSLRTPDGWPLGALGVIDTEPRPDGLTGEQASALERLAREVMAHLELRRSLAQHQAILGQLAEGVIVKDRAGRTIFANEAAIRLQGADRLEGAPGRAGSGDHRLMDGLAGPLAELGRAVRQGLTVRSARWRSPRLDDTEAVTSGSVRPFRDARGRRVGALFVLRDDTERSRAEAALRMSEAQLRATFDQVAVGLAHVDLDGRWLRVNDRLCTMLGYTRAELLERGFPDVTHPADIQANIACLHQLLVGQITTYTQEKRYVRKDGSVMWGNLAVALVRDASGAPEHFVSVIEDISERKHVEAARNDLLATLDLATLMARDLDDTIRFWSGGCERLFGWTAAEAIGRSAHTLLHTVFPEPRSSIDRALACRGEWTGDLRQRTRDGRDIVVTARKVLRSEAEGQPPTVLESLVDVTAQRQAEAAIRRSEARLRRSQVWLAGQKEAFQAAMNGAPLETSLGVLVRTATEQADGERRGAFYIVGEDGTTLRHLVGMTEDYARHVDGFVISPESLACGLAVARGEPVITPDVLDDPRWESWRWLARESDYRACWSFPVGSAGGRPVGTFAMYFREPHAPSPEDMELAAALTQTASILISHHQEAEERARAEARLRDSRARLKELQAELLHISRLSAASEMAAALAHELNQPLSAIVNYVGAGQLMLSDGGPSEPGRIAEAREVMDLAAEQALRAGQIIRRLRGFMAKGEADVRPEDLRSLAEEASMLALSGAREQDVRPALHFDPELPPVVVDRVQIQQVLVNLIRNAIEAMVGEEGATAPARREIVVRAGPAGPEMVEVSVADTGPGLASEVAARLFEPFTSTKPQGMGVGLSISRSIVELHGGRLWAEPNAPRGTVFRFTLPVAPAQGGRR